MSWNQCLNWETSFAKSPTILLSPSLGLADRILALITQSVSGLLDLETNDLNQDLTSSLPTPGV